MDQTQSSDQQSLTRNDQLIKQGVIQQRGCNSYYVQYSYFPLMPTPISKSRLCLSTPTSAHLLANPIQNTHQSSNSFLLSLANFLSKQAKLYPQSIMHSSHQDQHKYSSRPLPAYQPQHYLQIWCDYLFSLLSANQLMQIGNQCILIASVSQKYLEYALSSNIFQRINNFQNNSDLKTVIAQQFYSIKWQHINPQNIKKILIINLSQSVTNVDKTKTKINVDCLFSGMYYQHGDLWQSYKILLQQIPTVQQLTRADTVMISGSTFSVNSMHPFMKTFQKNLVQALKINKKLKVTGFCFGHQLIAHAYGGRIQKNSLIRGPEIITSKHHDLGELPYMSQMSPDSLFKLKMYEYHSDYVVGVPEGFVTIGGSNSCSNEMVVSTDKRIFTFQFHPQYLVQYIRSIQQRWNKQFGFQGIHLNTDQQVDQEHHETSSMFRKVLRNFIDWQVGTN